MKNEIVIWFLIIHEFIKLGFCNDKFDLIKLEVNFDKWNSFILKKIKEFMIKGYVINN